MGVLWFWLIIICLVIAIFALPTWPYTRNRGVYRRPRRWRYAPSGLALIVGILILFLFWWGILAIWWPWGIYPADVI